MHIIIIGASALGDGLTGLALEAGHEVAVIEEDQQKVEAAASSHDVLALHGTVAEAGMLDEARADIAGAMIATTHDDSANLMAVFLGREHNIETLVTVVNHNHHARLFERLGVNMLVDPELVIARQLLDIGLHPGARDVSTLSSGDRVFEFVLPQASPLTSESLGQLHGGDRLPASLRIVAVRRDGEGFFPDDDTRLQARDEVTVISRDVLSDRVMALFAGQNQDS